MGEGRCRDLLQSGGWGHIKGRGSTENCCRAERGGRGHIKGGFEWLYCREDVGGVREGAEHSGTAEKREGAGFEGKRD